MALRRPRETKKTAPTLDGFDESFYVKRHPDSAQYPEGPAAHFRVVGSARLANPNESFSTRFYTIAYGADTVEWASPFDHYVEVGRKLGLCQWRQEALEVGGTRATISEGTRTFVSRYFDDEWYSKQYQLADLARTNLLEHYLSEGWQNGADPAESFETRFYRRTFMFGDASDTCPLDHYARLGKPAALPTSAAEAQRRATEIRQGRDDETTRRLASLPTPVALALIAPNFDDDFYRGSYPDVADAGIDPLWHYFSVGWLEGRNPSRHFDGDYYRLRHIPKGHGLDRTCPLLHFATVGRFMMLRASPRSEFANSEETQGPAVALVVHGSARFCRASGTGG